MSTEIYAKEGMITTNAPREGKRGFTVWFTGLSGSGKSTLAEQLDPVATVPQLVDHHIRDRALAGAREAGEPEAESGGVVGHPRPLSALRAGPLGPRLTAAQGTCAAVVRLTAENVLEGFTATGMGY